MSSTNAIPMPETTHRLSWYDVINFGCDCIYDFFVNFKLTILPVSVSAIGGSLTNYFAGSTGSINFSRGLFLGLLQHCGYLLLFKRLGYWVYNNTGEGKLKPSSASVLYGIGEVAQIYLPLLLMQKCLPTIAYYWNIGCHYIPFFSNWFTIDATVPFSITLGFICGFVPSLTAIGLTIWTEESEKDVKKMTNNHRRR